MGTHCEIQQSKVSKLSNHGTNSSTPQHFLDFEIISHPHCLPEMLINSLLSKRFVFLISMSPKVARPGNFGTSLGKHPDFNDLHSINYL